MQSGYRIWRIVGDRLTGWWYTGYAWAPEVSEQKPWDSPATGRASCSGLATSPTW
jgi:hypothetical protein